MAVDLAGAVEVEAAGEVEEEVGGVFCGTEVSAPAPCSQARSILVPSWLTEWATAVEAPLEESDQMDANYNFPVIALKALTAYQPRDYQFALDGRSLFDITKIPKGIKVLNGDIGEDVAKSQAKTLVDQLQSDKAHAKYHMIQQLTTQSEVGDVELLHAPIWFAKYDHKGNKIILVVDANSGRVINSIGLS